MNLVKTESNQDNMSDISEDTPEYIYISPYDSPEESVLHRSFDSIGSLNKKNVFLCLYHIKEDCYIEGEDKRIQDDTYTKIKENIEVENPKIYNQYYPHLEFLFQQKNENTIMTTFSSNSSKWTFPYFLYEPTHYNEKDEEESQINIEFETECIKYFTELFKNIHDLNSNEIMKMYKGFFYKDENKGSLENEREHTKEDNIYAFFDMTFLLNQNISILPDEENKIKYEWAIIDEIVYNKKCKNNDFEPDVFNVFQNNPELQTITTTNGNNFPFPFQLYGCKKDENGKYINITKKENIQPVEHEKFGISYIFTSDPLDPSSTDTLERFACFIVDAYYNLDDIDSEQENKDAELVKKEMNQRFPNTDIINILGEPLVKTENISVNQTTEIHKKDDLGKNTKNDNNRDDDSDEDKRHDDDSDEDKRHDDDSDEDDSDEDDSDEDDSDEDDSDEDESNKKEKIKNNILISSTIYFHENGRQMWAIKNNLHFTII